MGLGAIPMAVLRANYALWRFPFQVIDDVGMTRLGEQAPARVVYERVLGLCDRAAGHLLADESVAARDGTRRQRAEAARAEHRRRLESAACLEVHRAKFRHRRQRSTQGR
jgi:hypothetical protein